MDWDGLAEGQLNPRLYVVMPKFRLLFSQNKILLKKTIADSNNSPFRSVGTQFTMNP